MADKYITIYKKGDVHIVDMLQKNILTPKSEIPLDKKLVDEICQEVQRVTLMANRMLYEKASDETRADIVKNLRNTGEVLFRHLFPEDIQRALKESDESDLYLRLDEKLLHIPWELCFDGEEFMSLKFRIGRQVLTEKRTTASIKSLQKEQITMLVIIDPSETLKYAQKEAESLFSILEAETDIKIELIGGRHANKLHLLKEMKEKDIVHFIGHSFYDENHPEKSGWILKDGVLTSEEISRMDSPPLIVFSNSCQSVATVPQGVYLFDEKASGIGGGFMIAGVRNFIGPIWVIHDENSVKFAVDFYSAFVSGKTLGQSLQDAKRNVIKTDGLSNLLWASYMLYGDPSVKITEKEEEVKNDEKVTSAQTISSENKRRSKMNLKTISFILLFCIILIFGYLSWKGNWFSKNGETDSSSITAPENTTLSKQNNYASIDHKSEKTQESSVPEQGYIPAGEKSKRQVSNIRQKGLMPSFQNSFLKVTLQSISKSKDKKRVNLVLILENVSKEDIFIALKEKKRVHVSLLDDHGGEWTLTKQNGIEIIKGPGWTYHDRKKNYSIFNPGAKNTVVMAFGSSADSEATTFNLSADLWRYINDSATLFSFGISDMQIYQ